MNNRYLAPEVDRSISSIDSDPGDPDKKIINVLITHSDGCVTNESLTAYFYGISDALRFHENPQPGTPEYDRFPSRKSVVREGYIIPRQK